jgi:hypothetical protein
MSRRLLGLKKAKERPMRFRRAGRTQQDKVMGLLGSGGLKKEGAGVLLDSHNQFFDSPDTNWVSNSSIQFYFSFFLAVLEFELRTLHLLGRCSTT